MIQRALLGETKPEEERELQRINWQRDAKNKGMVIQMPPMHTTVKFQCIMDVFTLSSLITQVRAICVNSIKGSCPK